MNRQTLLFRIVSTYVIIVMLFSGALPALSVGAREEPLS